jgi:hypothetical protein
MAGVEMFAEGTEAERRRAAKKAQALILLGEGKHYPEVAATVGIGKRTLAKWLADDEEFRRALSELRVAKTSELTSRMVSSAAGVVDMIHREAFEGERSADRIRAGGLYVQLTIRLHHEADVEQRVRRVEERLGLVKQRGATDVAAADDDLDPDAADGAEIEGVGGGAEVDDVDGDGGEVR